MKKRAIILSVTLLSVLILAVTACAELQNDLTSQIKERNATQNDRAYARTHTVYNGSFKSELTEEELVFYDAFEQHFCAERSLEPFEIDISKMCFLKDESEYVKNVIDLVEVAFKRDYPEVYWLDIEICEVSFEINGSYISKAIIHPREHYEGAISEWETVQNGIDSSVKEIVELRQSESRYDTAKAIHDYLCDNLSYYTECDDAPCPEQQCVSPLFGGGHIGKKVVCEGYALSFKLLCDRLGIPAAAIYSRGHVYNYVQMDDGCYYVVDCTWDDGNTEGWNKTDYFYNEVHYEYFLIGEKTILRCWNDNQNNPVAHRFNDDLEHVEYHYLDYHETQYNIPLIYPTVSEQAYSRIEWLNEAETEISGIVSLKFRYNGNDFAGKKATVYFDNKKIGSPAIDENGLFEITYDTTQRYNGYCDFKVTLGDTSFTQKLLIMNKQFEILNWGDEIRSVSEPFEVQVKGYSTGSITDCNIAVWADAWVNNQGYISNHVNLGSYSFNEDGIASFVIDPKKYVEGLHRFSVFFHKPGSDYKENYLDRSESRSFRISHTSADSGKFRFWGNSAKKDRYVGELADFTLKYDGSVTEQCQFQVTIDDSPVTPIRQGGGDKVTDFFDKDGYGTFYLDVTGQSNGKHTVNAQLIKEDGTILTATNTVYTTDGIFNFTIDDSDGTHMEIKNISGFPGNQCRFAFGSAEKLFCDQMLMEPSNIFGKAWMNIGMGDENNFGVNLGFDVISYGDNVIKVVFLTPDGKIVEKNLAFQVQISNRSSESVYFYSPVPMRNLGETADFTLFFDTPYPECKSLAITLDGKSANVKIPDNPISAFDRFGRFFFTLDLSDLPEGKHTVKAELIKSNGVVMTAVQKIIVTKDYFELTKDLCINYSVGCGKIV